MLDRILLKSSLHLRPICLLVGQINCKAFHVVVSLIKKAIGYKEIALKAFIGIQEAFDSIYFEKINLASKQTWNMFNN